MLLHFLPQWDTEATSSQGTLNGTVQTEAVHRIHLFKGKHYRQHFWCHVEQNLDDLLNLIFNLLYYCCFTIRSGYLKKILIRRSYYFLTSGWSLEGSLWNCQPVSLNLKWRWGHCLNTLPWDLLALPRVLTVLCVFTLLISNALSTLWAKWSGTQSRSRHDPS